MDKQENKTNISISIDKLKKLFLKHGKELKVIEKNDDKNTYVQVKKSCKNNK